MKEPVLSMVINSIVTVLEDRDFILGFILLTEDAVLPHNNSRQKENVVVQFSGASIKALTFINSCLEKRALSAN